MKKRICSLLLICSMLAGLLPQIVLPQAAAADIRTMFNRCFSIAAAKEKKQKKIIF